MRECLAVLQGGTSCLPGLLPDAMLNTHTPSQLPMPAPVLRWAAATLQEHAGDPRPAALPYSSLDSGASGDAWWDAAQRQLRKYGELHNNSRMTWGKAFIGWAPSPQAALRCANGRRVGVPAGSHAGGKGGEPICAHVCLNVLTSPAPCRPTERRCTATTDGRWTAVTRPLMRACCGALVRAQGRQIVGMHGAELSGTRHTPAHPPGPPPCRNVRFSQGCVRHPHHRLPAHAVHSGACAAPAAGRLCTAAGVTDAAAPCGRPMHSPVELGRCSVCCL